MIDKEISPSDMDKEDSNLDSVSIGLIAESLVLSVPDESQKKSMKLRLMQKIHPGDGDVNAIQTVRADEGDWIDIAPLVKMKVLHRDNINNSQTSLLKLEAGAYIPPHPHPVEEECLMLQGEITFNNHSLREGDYEFVAAGTDHGELTSESGALLMLRSEIPGDLSWMTV